MDDRIRDLFAALLQVSPDTIDNDARPATIPRWDSMQHLILVSGFEEEFSIDVDPEEAVDMYRDFATFKKVILQKVDSGA